MIYKLRYLLIAVFVIASGWMSDAKSQTAISNPSWVSVSSSPTDSRAIGWAGGKTFTYSATPWPAYEDTCYLWGLPNTITGLIRGNNTGTSCTGLNSVVYSSGSSNLSGGILVYTGVTPYYYQLTSGGWTTTNLSVRLTVTITDNSNNAIAISSLGSIKYIQATETFKVNVLIETYSPSGASYISGSANTWTPAITLFNNLHTYSLHRICTSFEGSFYYVQHKATIFATDTVVCDGDVVTFSNTATSTAVSRLWTGPLGNTSTASSFSTTMNSPGQTGYFYLSSTGDASCPSPIDSIYTYVSPTMTSSATATNVSCNGVSDGVATASQTGGTSPFTYSWNTGATTASVSGLAAGTYSVTVTDSAGCTDSSSVTITQPATLVASTSLGSNVSCNGLSDGSATASATGGTTAYTYSWNTGATTATITGLAASTYSVTITDANSCTDSASVTITQPATLVASSTIDSTVSCLGYSDGGATASATGGTTAYTYSWNTGATTASITGMAAGTYSVTITDANSCTDSASSVITQPALFVSSATVDSNVSCFGYSDGVATASGVSLGTNTYSWSNGATTATATGLAAGTYSVTVTNPSGCTDSSSVTITQPTLLVSSAVIDSNVSCNGYNDGGATASATGGTTTYAYSWSNGATTASITGVAAGTYSVTITDANGCTDSSSVIITQPTALVSSASVDNAVSCNGLSDGGATASATGGTGAYTYSWSNSATTASITGVVASTYSVTITDANGCTDSSSVVITEPATLVASTSLDNNVSCNGLSDGGATASATGGTTAYTYSWNTGATTASITGLAANTYSVTITDANSCTDSASITITEPATLVSSAAVDNNVSCNGFSDGGATATATGGTTVYTYSWNTGATTASITGLAANTYSVTITDANSCTDSSSITITEPTALVSSAVVDSTVSCNGFSDGGATASATGGTGAYTYSWSNGATNASITGVVAGTYSVTITDANSCTDSSSVSITQPAILVSSAVVDSTISCNGLSDGGATASGTGGTGVYTYSWSNSATTASITGVVAGTYSVTITDANGCTDSASVTITQPNLLVTSASVDDHVSCNGLSDGGATASATGGTTVYTYSWNTGATTATITGLAAATYSVTITDANGCTDSASVTVTEPATLVSSVALDSNVSCNGFFDGGATASATGGTTAYTYAWNNGATTASITGVAAATYSVTITDANSCTDSSSITITEPTTLVSSAVVDSTVSCNGFSDGGATASATGGTGTYTYSWSNGATNASITGVVAGTYSVTVTDANGCTDSSSAIITQPAALVVSTVVDSTISCNGLSDGGATASGTGGTGAYTYSWSNSATTASITGVVAGTYSVTITDANGCTDSTSVTITEPNVLVAATAVDSNVSCNSLSDGGATASATGGTTAYSYSWSNSATTASITGVIAGTYSVTITDANGCTDSSSVEITEPATLVSSTALDSNVSCNGFANGGATASATGGTTAYAYSWSNGATTASITGVVAGTYSVTITDANGCTDSSSITITEPTVLVSSAVVDSNVSCFGYSDGGATASATGGTTAYTYSWSNGTTTATISNVVAGTYSVTITDAQGCTDSSSVMITEPSGMVSSAVVDSTISCNGESDGGATVSATGGTTPYTYSWSTTSTATFITGVTAGAYSVTVTDAQGCTDSSSVNITEPAVLLATATVDSNVSCNGYSDGGITVSGAGGTTAYSYNWSNSATTASITGLTAGTYSVTITDANGCTDSTSITVTEPAVLVSSTALDSNVSCNGFANGGATASATGGTTAYAYSWSNGATTASITGVVAGTYSVTITDANGCTDSSSITITEPTVLVSSAVVDSNVSCFGYSDGGATASATGGTTAYAYSWSNGTTTATISNVVAGTYSVTITDAQGCTDSSSVTITEPSGMVSSAVVDSTISCNGESDGGATVSATGGTTPYTYSWSTTSTATFITGVTAGSYSVTVTDGNGCTDSSSVTITEPAILVSSASLDSNVSCFGFADGGATSSAVGGTLPYAYSWNNSAITASVIGLTASTYSVTITDVNGCTDSSSVTITEPTVLVVSAALDSNVSCFGYANGGATVTASGGTTGYGYAWSNGTTTSFITGVVANTYTATVTDANGCEDNASVVVGTTPDTVNPTIVCPGNDTLPTNASCQMTVPDYTALAITGDNCDMSVDVTQSPPSGTVLTGLGDTTITLTATDDSANVSTCTFVLTRIDTMAPALTCPADDTLYLGGSCTVPLPDYTTSAVSADECTPVTLTQSVASGTSMSTVNAVVAITITASDSSGNETTCSFNVTVLDTTSPDITSCVPTQTVAADANCQYTIPNYFGLLTASDNCSSVLSYSQNPTVGTVVSLGTMNIGVTVTDSSGNSDSCTFTLTVADSTAPVITCPGDSLIVSDSGQCGALVNYTAPFATDNCTSVNTIVQTEGLASGSFFPVGVTYNEFVATDTAGNSDTCSFEITVIDTTPPLMACHPDTVIYNDLDSCGATFTFSDPVVTDECGVDSLYQTVGLPSGSHFPVGNTLIEFKAVDSNGLVSYCSFNILVVDTQAPSIVCVNDTTICDTTFTFATPFAEDNCGVDSIEQIAGIPSGGTYPLGTTINTFVAYDTSGNTDTCSFSVTRDEELTEPADAGEDGAYCEETTLNLDATAPPLGTGVWTSLGNATVTDSLNEASAVNGLVYGLNQFVWTVTNGVCAALTDTVSIQIDENPSQADAGEDQDLCEAYETSMEAADPAVGIGVWSTSAEAVIGDSGSVSSLVSELNLGVNEFTWTINNGVCTPTSDVVNIEVNNDPIITANDDKLSFGGVPVQLNASSDIPVTYAWSPSTIMDDAASETPRATAHETVEIVVEGMTEAGCFGYDTLNITVINTSGIYNGISPNGDGFNDVWEIQGIESYPEARISLYNRQGILVFEATNYQNDFDGKHNGKPLPAATYYYVIELNDGMTDPFDGTLTIIY